MEYGVILQAAGGSQRALMELGLEIRTQVAIRLPLLNGNRMTREKAAQLAAARRR